MLIHVVEPLSSSCCNHQFFSLSLGSQEGHDQMKTRVSSESLNSWLQITSCRKRSKIQVACSWTSFLFAAGIRKNMRPGPRVPILNVVRYVIYYCNIVWRQFLRFRPHLFAFQSISTFGVEAQVMKLIVQMLSPNWLWFKSTWQIIRWTSKVVNQSWYFRLQSAVPIFFLTEEQHHWWSIRSPGISWSVGLGVWLVRVPRSRADGTGGSGLAGLLGELKKKRPEIGKVRTNVDMTFVSENHDMCKNDWNILEPWSGFDLGTTQFSFEVPIFFWRDFDFNPFTIA